ncbi:uncharacterized protein LOC124491435 [Dermatophagoides farinae]|uniref:uncharacterized protein LOC124491435 n=1 Tax=Dermatophagoides farinae TaxID=6954 RepID=UPI003F613013
MNLINELLSIIRNCFLLICGLLIISGATLELIFAPMLLGKYYLPSIIHHIQQQQQQHQQSCLIIFFYTILMTIQLFNMIASILLFYHIFITNYHDKWLAYDSLMLISITMSLALILYQKQMDWNFYQEIVKKDFYIQINRIGDYVCQRSSSSNSGNDLRNYRSTTTTTNQQQQCQHSDVYYWHQMNRCCGWQSPSDLLGLIKNTKKISNKNISNDDNSIDDHRLPEFCCESIISRNGGGGGGFRNLNRHNIPFWMKRNQNQNQNKNYCHLQSPFIFNRTCNDDNQQNHHQQQKHQNYRYTAQSFMSLRNLSLINHPIDLIYILLKLFGTLVYTYCKQHLLPQIEGPYSFYLVP